MMFTDDVFTDVFPLDVNKNNYNVPTIWEYGPCPLYSINQECKWMGRYKDIYEHFLDDHPKRDNIVTVDLLDGSRTKMFNWKNYFTKKGDENSFFAVLLEAYGQLFFFVSQIQNESTYVQMNFLGKPDDQNTKYSWEFNISNKHIDIYMHMLCSWNLERNMAIDTAHSPVLYTNLLKRHCVGDDFVFTLKINKVNQIKKRKIYKYHPKK